MWAYASNEASDRTDVAKVYVSVGSNVRPRENLRLACHELRERFGDMELSSVYRNPPVGFAGDDFLNLVVAFDSDRTPARIAAELEEIHSLAGRDRRGERFAPRTLDLDLLLYDDLVQDDRGLRLPREDVVRYDFVLAPLVELAPDLRHPVDGRRLRDIWEAFDGPDRGLTIEDFEP
jgi:2-amino-4-hydroxy-6-hydroxymethyldihydropteridine diphosphokinase